MQAKPIVLVDLRPLQSRYKNKGIGRYTYELARAIHLKYPIYALQNKSESPLPLEIPVLITAPRWKRQWVWDIFILPFILKLKGVRLFHNFVALGPLDSISYPALFARKCLITIHDLHMFHKMASPLNKFYSTTKRIQLQKKYLTNVYHIVTDAETTAKEINSFVNLTPGKISVVPLGCDHVNNWKTTHSISAQYQDLTHSKYILSIGDTENKNLHLGYLILTTLRQNLPQLKWIICGEKQAIQENLQIASLPPWIIPLKPSDSDLYHLYRNSSLTLIPSIEEGFGIPVLEAIKIGSPAIAGNLEVFLEHLPEPSHLNPLDLSQNSIEQWSQACERVLNDKTHRKLMVEKGWEHSKKYTWAKAAEKIISYYPE